MRKRIAYLFQYPHLEHTSGVDIKSGCYTFYHFDSSGSRRFCKDCFAREADARKRMQLAGFIEGQDDAASN